jgi:predicted alpha/beta-fold hydrolase
MFGEANSLPFVNPQIKQQMTCHGGHIAVLDGCCCF